MVTELVVQERAFCQTKGQLRQLRLSGWLPGIVYGGRQQPMAIQIGTKGFIKNMAVPGLYTRVFDLGKKGKALLKAVQFPATKDIPLHVDFLRLEKGGRVTVSVPLRFIGEEKSPGLTRGGILNVVHYTLDLIVPADAIPPELSISVADLNMGDSVPIHRIVLPKGAHPVHTYQPEDIVASVVAPSGLPADEEVTTETDATETDLSAVESDVTSTE